MSSVAALGALASRRRSGLRLGAAQSVAETAVQQFASCFRPSFVGAKRDVGLHQLVQTPERFLVLRQLSRVFGQPRQCGARLGGATRQAIHGVTHRTAIESPGRERKVLAGRAVTGQLQMKKSVLHRKKESGLINAIGYAERAFRLAALRPTAAISSRVAPIPYVLGSGTGVKLTKSCTNVF